MAGASKYLTTAVFNQYFVGKPTYVALFTDNPTDENDTSKEITASWYGRKQATFGAAQTDAGKELIKNETQVLFSRVTGTPVRVKYWGVYDAETGGNLLISEKVPSDDQSDPDAGQSIAVGTAFLADVAALKVTFD